MFRSTAQSFFVGAIVLLLMGCASGSGSGSMDAVESVPAGRVPYKPGASLTSSRLCECTACEPAHCCEGSAEGAELESCASGHDFSACETSISSCARRCYAHSFRVPKHLSCDERRPAVCCTSR